MYLARRVNVANTVALWRYSTFIHLRRGMLLLCHKCFAPDITFKEIFPIARKIVLADSFVRLNIFCSDCHNHDPRSTRM